MSDFPVPQFGERLSFPSGSRDAEETIGGSRGKHYGVVRSPGRTGDPTEVFNQRGRCSPQNRYALQGIVGECTAKADPIPIGREKGIDANSLSEGDRFKLIELTYVELLAL